MKKEIVVWCIAFAILVQVTGLYFRVTDNFFISWWEIGLMLFNIYNLVRISEGIKNPTEPLTINGEEI